MYDLIIVGGGMAGIAAGHMFRNHDITILEKHQLLSGASGKNAGFVISGFGEHFVRTINRLGLHQALEIEEMHLRSHARIREITGSSKTRGSLAVAIDEEERHELKASYELLKEHGFDVEWLEDPDVGLRQTRAAILNHHDGVIDSAQFWKKLAEALPVRENCEVFSVFEEDGCVSLETERGIFQARNVVFCVDGASASLIPELEGRLILLRGQMLELGIESKAPTERPVFAEHGDIYWRFEGSKLIFGGLEHLVPAVETWNAEDVSLELLQKQLRWINEHFSIETGSLLRSWSGPIALTPDGFPYVGPLARNNIFILAGFCGMGNSYALECASWLFQWIVDGRNVIPSYCSSDRLSALPVYSGGNWRVMYEAWNH